jgi:hypothetical protein
MTQRPKQLLDQERDAIRLKHYAYSTGKTYVGWIKRYIHFHGVLWSDHLHSLSI